MQLLEFSLLCLNADLPFTDCGASYIMFCVPVSLAGVNTGAHLPERLEGVPSNVCEVPRAVPDTKTAFRRRYLVLSPNSGNR